MIFLIVSLGSLGPALAQDAKEPARVSVVSLIANPAAYEGKRVLVAGYLTTIHFEDCAVYLGKVDFDRQIVQNAVRLDWKECSPKPALKATPWAILSGRYAAVEGTFRRGSSLDRGSYAGVVGEVTRVQPILSRAEFVKHDTMPWWRENLLLLALASFFVVVVTVAAGWITLAIQSIR